MTDHIAERRTNDRVPTRSLVEVKIPDWSAFQRIYSVNISKGGMQLSLGRHARVGMPIDIILTLPNGRRLHLPGEVAHFGGGPDGDVGVRFGELPTKTRDEMEGYVELLRAGHIPSSATPAGGIPTGWLIKKKS